MKMRVCIFLLLSQIFLVGCEPTATPGGELSYTGTLHAQEANSVSKALIEYCKESKCSFIQNGTPVPGLQTFFLWLEPTKNERLLVSDRLDNGTIEFLWTQVDSSELSDSSKTFLGLLKNNGIELKIEHSARWICDPGQKLSFKCRKQEVEHVPSLDLFALLPP